jgi:hypothetical protein
MAKRAQAPKRSERSNVSLPASVLEKARKLSALASQHGWIALGVNRADPATITAIFEEAINGLAGRATKQRGIK